MQNYRCALAEMQKLFHKFGVDRAVLFGLLSRIWGICAGPVTAILIATKFTPEIQGYYYTFTTILALQVFVELGLGTVIIQFASHEWAKLKLDENGRIVGDRDSLSRLISIANIATKWYAIAGLLVAVGLGVGGYFFFSGSKNTIAANWMAPWLSLCLLTGIAIYLVPVWSLLEGCNQVARLYTFRFYQGLLTTLSAWIAILSGAELWTASIASVATLLAAIYFLRRGYWKFLTTLTLSKPMGQKIKWRADMLPMQWRIALSWISGYFIFSLFVPVLFKFHGPVVAGQMGMTLSIVGIVGSVSASWLSPRAPQFGMLVHEKKYRELDVQLWKVARIVLSVSGVMVLITWSFVFLLNNLDSGIARQLSTRILPPFPLGMLLLAQFIYLSVSPLTTYLRAHKKEPLVIFSLVYAAMVGSSTFFLGKSYSAVGMALGYLIMNVILMPVIFWIWYRCRKEWHSDSYTETTSERTG